jgi:hypothetical protein
MAEAAEASRGSRNGLACPESGNPDIHVSPRNSGLGPRVGKNLERYDRCEVGSATTLAGMLADETSLAEEKWEAATGDVAKPGRDHRETPGKLVQRN